MPLITLLAREDGSDGVRDAGVADWAELSGHTPERGLFVARIVGGALGPKLPDGALALFRSRTKAPTSGAIALVNLAVREPTARYAVKKVRIVGKRSGPALRAKFESLTAEVKPVAVTLGEGASAEVLAELLELCAADRA